MSQFFFDTDAELWYEEADKMGLTNIIKMPYTIDGKEEYYDLGRNTNFEEFYAKVRRGIMPKTSALNPQDYIDYFEPVFARGEDILYISFSHAMSATFTHMQTALNELYKKYPDRKLTCFDTKNICVGAALGVYAAAQLHRNGKSDQEIVEFMNSFIKRIGIFFTVDDLHHLKRGGRITGTTAFVGSILNIKPILTVNPDGLIESYAKAKGRKKAMEFMLDKAQEAGIDPHYPVCVLATDPPEVEEMYSMFMSRFPNNQFTMWKQPIGPVIGTHCGPGTIGISFIKTLK